MSKKILFALVLVFVSAITLLAQDTGVDTTDIGYKVGYKIGTYLPITIILIIAIFFIRKAYRFKEEEK